MDLIDNKNLKVKKRISNMGHTNIMARPLTASQLKVISEVKKAATFHGEIKRDSDDDDDDEEEYDTDCETNDPSQLSFDNTGVDTYLKTCRKLKLSPIRQVYEGLMASKSIEVKNRGLNPSGALSITNALLVNVTVTTLCLDGNAICNKGLRYISWMLTENVSINSLSLNDNKFDSEGVAELCNTLKHSTTLVRLSLSGNGFQDSDMIHISNMLLHNNILQDLNLSYNNISDAGASYIAEALAVNDYLKMLDLSWNMIRPQGAVILFKSVQENVMLKNLNLAMNGISDHGCTALSHLLQNNESLTHLNISNSRLRDKDAVKLVSALLKNESLRSLNMSNNTLTSSTVAALLQSILQNESKSLLMLDMSGIHVFRSVLFFVHLIKKSRSMFKFLFGDLVTYNGLMTEEELDLISTCDPAQYLAWYFSVKNIKLSALENTDTTSTDSDSASNIVNQMQLKTILKKYGVILSKTQMDKLFLDSDGRAVDILDLQTFFP